MLINNANIRSSLCGAGGGYSRSLDRNGYNTRLGLHPETGAETSYL
jgi:hypothetical protein